MLKILGKAKPTDKEGLPNTRDWNANREAGLNLLELYVNSPADVQAIKDRKIPTEFEYRQAEVDQKLIRYITEQGLSLSSLNIPFIVTNVSTDFPNFLEANSKMFEDVGLCFESLPSTNPQRMREEAGTTPEELIEYVNDFKSFGIKAFVCVDICHLAQTELVRLFQAGRTLYYEMIAPLYEEHKIFLYDENYLARIRKKVRRSLNAEIDRARSGDKLAISDLFFTEAVKSPTGEGYNITKLPKLLVPSFESSMDLLRKYAKGYASVCDHKLVCRVGEPIYDPKWSYTFQFTDIDGRPLTANLFKTHLHFGRGNLEPGDFKPVLPQLIKATASLPISGFTIETNDKDPELLRQDKEYLMELL